MPNTFNHRMLQVGLAVAILTVLAGTAWWYRSYSSLKFTAAPSIVAPGETLSIQYRYFGEAIAEPCLFEYSVDSVIDDQGQNVLTMLEDIRPATDGRPSVEERLVLASGFADPDIYDQVRAGKTFIVERIGRCLVGGTPKTLASGWTKTTQRGESSRLLVLPATPAGQYTVQGSDYRVRVTVRR